jgi:hypothetical protein
MGNDFGRPPGTATTIAGPSLALMPVPNQHRHSPHHQNDDGTTNITHNSDLTMNQRIVLHLVRK